MLTPSIETPLLAISSPTHCGCGAEAGVGAANAVCDLNDQFRRDFSRGRVVMTAGVAALSADAYIELLLAVQSFDAFGAGNDPHGEHDFER